MEYLLNEQDIQKNKEDFIALLQEANKLRPFKCEELINKLESSDFFIAPASTKYHGAYPGGLCDHCLCVYHNLKSLVIAKHLSEQIKQDSIILVSLLHDFSKMGLYKLDIRNKKIYCESGSKKDSKGRFDWVSEDCYTTNEAEDRFIYGNHEETSEYMARQFVNLTYEESSAILNHHAGMGWDSAQGNISSIYNKYPLACLLHLADMISCYIEKA